MSLKEKLKILFTGYQKGVDERLNQILKNAEVAEMDDTTQKKLDEMSMGFVFRPVRKTSAKKTPETPNWNPHEGYWEESDVQFRRRLKR
jgi:hypothetical protein